MEDCILQEALAQEHVLKHKHPGYLGDGEGGGKKKIFFIFLF
jgi:hypothetical protein